MNFLVQDYPSKLARDYVKFQTLLVIFKS